MLLCGIIQPRHCHDATLKSWQCWSCYSEGTALHIQEHGDREQRSLLQVKKQNILFLILSLIILQDHHVKCEFLLYSLTVPMQTGMLYAPIYLWRVVRTVKHLVLLPNQVKLRLCHNELHLNAKQQRSNVKLMSPSRQLLWFCHEHVWVKIFID